MTNDNDLIRRGDAIALFGDSVTGKAIARCIAAIPAAHAPTVKVKPLVWDGCHPSNCAQTSFGEYVVQDDEDDGWGLYTPRELDGDSPRSQHKSEELAKAAAQSDYPAGIIAEIEVTAEPPTLAAALAMPEIAALVDAAKDGHDALISASAFITKKMGPQNPARKQAIDGLIAALAAIKVTP